MVITLGCSCVNSEHTQNAGRGLQYIFLTLGALLGWQVCGTIGIVITYFIYVARVSTKSVFYVAILKIKCKVTSPAVRCM